MIRTAQYTRSCMNIASTTPRCVVAAQRHGAKRFSEARMQLLMRQDVSADELIDVILGNRKCAKLHWLVLRARL